MTFAAELDEEFRTGDEVARVPPTVFYVNLTERCQLRCAHCITRAPERTEDGSARDLATFVVDGLRPHLEKARYLGLTHAGEPMLSSAFRPLLEAMPADAVVHLLTNGVAMTEQRFVECVELGVRSLSFSLDGMRAESNDLLRIGGRTRELQHRIRALSMLRHAEGFDVSMGISWTITRDNLGELESLVQYARGARLDWLKFEELYPINEHARSLLVDENEQARAIAQARAGAGGLTLVDHTRPYAVTRCGDESVELLRFADGDDRANRLSILPCRRPWEAVHIEPDGEVKPGSFHHKSAGNLRDADLLELWNREAFRAERRRVRFSRRCGQSTPTCPLTDFQTQRFGGSKPGPH